MAKKKQAKKKKPAARSRDYIGRVAADVLRDASRGVPEAIDVLKLADKELDPGTLVLTNGAERRLVTRVLLNRGWSPAAVDRILAPNEPPAAQPLNRLSPVDEAPRRTSELQLALGALEREQERLDHVVAELATRLEDVLTPAPPSTPIATGTTHADTRPSFPDQSQAVGRCVVGVARQLQRIGDRVFDITNRLQV